VFLSSIDSPKVNYFRHFSINSNCQQNVKLQLSNRKVNITSLPLTMGQSLPSSLSTIVIFWQLVKYAPTKKTEISENQRWRKRFH